MSGIEDIKYVFEFFEPGFTVIKGKRNDGKQTVILNDPQVSVYAQQQRANYQYQNLYPMIVEFF